MLDFDQLGIRRPIARRDAECHIAHIRVNATIGVRPIHRGDVVHEVLDVEVPVNHD